MPSSKVSTAGLRSGDFAIVGNTIDAILAGGKEGQELVGEERTILPGSKSGGVDVGEVPLLEDIPIVGPLFRNEAKEKVTKIEFELEQTKQASRKKEAKVRTYKGRVKPVDCYQETILSMQRTFFSRMRTRQGKIL